VSSKPIPGEAGREPALEAQQATLIGVLRRAGGRPVSYAELREAGVELPASVVSELELAGVPIERCFGGVHGERHVVGVRLAEPESEPEAPQHAGLAAALNPVGGEAEPTTGWSPVRVYRASPGKAVIEAAATSMLAVVDAGRRLRARGPRLLAPLALLVAAVIVGVVVLSDSGGGAVHRGTASVPRPRSAAHATPTTAQSTTTTTSSATTATVPPTPVSPALATDLESQGHALLQGGQYGAAIGVLRRALAATGEQAHACLEPSSDNCLTYAYALYDLGRALRLSGNSAAAVPILEARLEIDNQRSTVASELQLARQQGG
jgi:hypothetical protein